MAKKSYICHVIKTESHFLGCSLRDDGSSDTIFFPQEKILSGLTLIEAHQDLPSKISLEMKFQFATLFALVFAAVGLAHDSHHEDQMPMNYVKYPYQAMYPGDDEGVQ